jgi:hypothetical protein
VIDPNLSGAENARRGLEAWFEFVAQQGDAYRAIMHGGIGTDEAVGAILEEARSALVTRIMDGLELATPPPAVRVAVRSWIGAVETAALDWLVHGDPEPPVIIDIVMAGLFAQVVVASQHSPGVAIKVDLASGLRMLGPLLTGLPKTPA